jgi:hypothetical protein
MELNPPVWLLPNDCSVCHQGSALVLSVCLACNHLLVICDEEGSVFPNPRQLEAHGHPLTHIGTTCPTCSTTPISSFRAASDQDLTRAGFKPGEYV